METLQVLHIVVEVGILVAVVKATRAISQMEFRVELMWKEFIKKFGDSEGEESND
jgi:hypothetical protein